MAQIVDSYSESNYYGEQSVHGDATQQDGQSFLADGGILNSCQFYVRKRGLPTGNVYAKIYAHSGTFGSSSIATGSPLAVSDALDVSAIPTERALITLTFSGANKITLTNGAYYVVVFEYLGGDSLNCPEVGYDSSSPTAPGNNCLYYYGSWHAQSEVDAIFYVYKDDVVSPTIAADWDDVFEDITNENIYSGDMLIAGYYGIDNIDVCDMGLRFQLNVPKGATITSAKITLRYNPSDFVNDNCPLLIKAVDSDNCGQWAPDHPPCYDAKIATTVPWNANGYFHKEDTYDSPEIKTIIQAIVNRAGWTANNYIGLVIEDNGCPSGQFIAANNYPTTSPYAVLTVNYIAGEGAQTIQKSLKYTVKATPSTKTKSLKYTVEAAATAIQKSVTYRVKITPSAITKSLIYAIKRSVSAIQKSLAYKVIAPAAAVTKSLAYKILTTPDTITKTLNYRVAATPSAIQKTLQYVVTAVTIQKPLRYTILNFPASLSKSLTYKVTTGTSIKILQENGDFLLQENGDKILSELLGFEINKSLKYAVRIIGTTIKILQESGDFLLQENGDKILYAVRGTITKGLAYAILLPGAIDKSLKYTVETTPTAITKALEYRIARTIAEITKNLLYKVRQTPAAITKTLAYIVVSPHSITKNLRYCVPSTPSAITKALRYEIGITTLVKYLRYALRTTPSAKTKSLTYCIVAAPSAISKGLTYKIIAVTPITKSTKYTIRTTPATKTKSLKYTILSVPAGIIKPLKYAVKVSIAAITKALTYRIITTPAAITKTLIYAVKPSLAITKPLRYAIQSPAPPLTKRLAYHLLIGGYVDIYNPQNTEYQEKYGAQETEYNEKHAPQNTTYEEKYPGQETSYNEKYPPQDTDYEEKYP